MRIYLCIFVITLCSCGPELPETKTVVDRIYQQKVAEYTLRKDKECKYKALEDALAHVDTIDLPLNPGFVDSLQFPARPVKPTTPEHIIGTVQKFETGNR